MALAVPKATFWLLMSAMTLSLFPELFAFTEMTVPFFTGPFATSTSMMELVRP